jgi:hypothetical protein
MSDEAKFTQAQVDALIKDRLMKVREQRDEWKAKHEALQIQYDEQAAAVVGFEKQIKTFEAAGQHTEGLQQQLAEANARWEAAQAVSSMGLGLGDTASLRALYSAAAAGDDGKKPAFGDWLKAEAAAEGSFVARVVGAAKVATPKVEEVPTPQSTQAPPTAAPKVPSPVAGVKAPGINGAAGGVRLEDMAPADIVRLSTENPQAYMQALGLSLPGAAKA